MKRIMVGPKKRRPVLGAKPKKRLSQEDIDVINDGDIRAFNTRFSTSTRAE